LAKKFTSADKARIMSTESRRSGGTTPKGSLAQTVQRTVDRREGAQSARRK